MNQLYPIFIKLRNKKCIVIGGGTVAHRKIQALLAAEAEVTVISPQLTDMLKPFIWDQKIKFLNRGFRSGDLADAFLVIAATDDPNINREVWQEANEKNILVNVVDVPDRCNFYVPSVLRDGALALAISTNGKAPYLAKRLRIKLTNYLQHFKFNEIINKVNNRKQQLKKQFPDHFKKREQEIKTFIDNLMNEL